ncbi:MAG: tyrosine decarboxylase MfnA [Methanobacteriaceae archaeon]|nr:tyrosine decarboxylase MfnA [Methanobacteriaceae archaeon]
MLEKQLTDKETFKELNKYVKQDNSFKSGHILGSMCTTPHPVGIKAYKMFLETNLGDPGLFKGTSQMEKEVIHILGNLLHNDTACGYIVTGGTEANITAMAAAKFMFQKENNNVPEMIIPESAHFSFEKIGKLLSLKIKRIKLNKDYTLNIEDLKQNITNNTMAIVSVAGTTELGLIDPIPEISDIAYDENIYLHVDAAFGGFILPFLDDDSIPDFDFINKGVSSITIDPHKMGRAPIPSGGILFRNEDYLKELKIKTPYLTINEQSTISGTRTGASVAATWALLNYLGKKGYIKETNNVMKNTNYLYGKLNELSLDIIVKPKLNIVAFKSSLISVNDLKKSLDDCGWKVSTSIHPESIRIVVMPHVKKEHIDNFVSDLKLILDNI